MNISIRKATINDAHILAELGGKTFYDTFRPYNSDEDMLSYIKKAYSVEVITHNLNQKNIIYSIAFDNNLPVGYTKLIAGNTYDKLENSRTIEMEKIYVLKNYFDKKVGKLLMEDAITYSRNNKYEVLFLGVWVENERAVDFYKKFGFEVFNTRSFQLGSRICDDYMMKLSL